MSRTLTTDPRDRGMRAGDCAWPPIPQEFVVNEALMVEGDPCLHGEINRFRGKRALVDTLEHLQRGAQKQVNDITKELLGTE